MKLRRGLPVTVGMLTGRQLRTARKLLGLQPSKLAERMRVSTRLVKIAESIDDECNVTLSRADRIRAYLEDQGIEFLPLGSEPVARLRPERR